jgi:D-glycero-alpha-D-manno-heptose-7-phosphate kinase
VAKSYVEDLDNKRKLLQRIGKMVDEGISILQGNTSICKFGELLHETWMLKKGLSSKVSNKSVDELYSRARRAGAIGGKITGAGGGGFLLLFVPPSKQDNVREALGEQILVPFRFEFNGSQIIFYEPEREDYSALEIDRSKRFIRAFEELDPIKE